MLPSEAISSGASAHALLAGRIQTTVVTLDRGWGGELAQSLRDSSMPTLLPVSPARWLQDFDPDGPNCIVFDLDHGGAGALGAISQLAAGSRLSVIVAAATAPSLKIVVGAIRAGAHDFVNKRFPLSEISHQIWQAGQHLLERQSATTTASMHRGRIVSLTRREREILDEIAGGLNTKQIAIKLSITPRTVQMFRDRIRRRLAVNSVEEAVALWIQFGDKPRLQLVE